jgi:ribulose-phosphate 3-epimerase
MVEPVDALVPLFAKAGANIITFHPEASRHVDRTLQLIRDHGCKAGLVFNPATPLEWMDHVMDRLDVVLLMSVNPGFGGQKFIPSTLPKLQAARQPINAHVALGGQSIVLLKPTTSPRLWLRVLTPAWRAAPYLVRPTPMAVTGA